MKRVVMILAVVAILAPASLWAQESPKAEIFGGFSLLSSKDSEDSERTTFKGWQASVAGNLNDRFAIVGDLGGHYKSFDGTRFSLLEIMGGPRVTHRLDRAAVFAHALYGFARGSGGGSSDTDFAMAYGGGVDIKATDKVDIRIVQFDWVLAKEESAWSKNNLRFGFGVVYKIAR